MKERLYIPLYGYFHTAFIRKSLWMCMALLMGSAFIPAQAASKKSRPKDNLAPSSPTSSTQVGKASWYGGRDIGRLTASGELYHRMDVTAAHRNLPFNTQVLVTNLKNGKQVVVRVNDRGPYIKGRIIDLSYEAAQSIGMVNSGVIPVRLQVLDNQRTPTNLSENG